MEIKHTLQRTKVFFSKWSRKAYAIFASLGKDIKICRISVMMCKTSILKLKNFAIYIFGDQLISENYSQDDFFDDISIEILEQVYTSLKVSNKKVAYSLDNTI